MLLLKFAMQNVTEELLYFKGTWVTKCWTNVGKHILTVSDAEHNKKKSYPLSFIQSHLFYQLGSCYSYWPPQTNENRFSVICGWNLFSWPQLTAYVSDSIQVWNLNITTFKKSKTPQHFKLTFTQIKLHLTVATSGLTLKLRVVMHIWKMLPISVIHTKIIYHLFVSFLKKKSEISLLL